MAAKLYLVDGMSHFYRAYYAIQGLTNSKGLPTNAVYGFTNMLRKLIKEEQPEFLGVAIDLGGPTVRHEKYEDYKATRPPAPPDLLQQVPYLSRVCEVLRIPVLSYRGYEADDVLGTLAAKASQQELETVIVTIDKDMYQLVGPQVTILDTRDMKRLDSEGVRGKFGVPPERVVDVLSLIGDSSDNIPGAPGIGEKGARKLINEYGDLDNLLAHREEVGRKTYRESLQNFEQQIRQSRELATIHVDLPIDLDLEALRLSAPDLEAARELFSELQFTSLLEDFTPLHSSGAADYTVVDNASGIGRIAKEIGGLKASLAFCYPGEISLDRDFSGMAISCRENQAWFLPAPLLRENRELAAPLFRSPRFWILHDLKPFYFLAEQEQWPGTIPLQDTMLMAYLLAPNQSNFSLKKLALDFLQLKIAAAGDSSSSGALWREQCQRADVTGQIFGVLEPRIDDLGLRALMEEIELPLVAVLARMEQIGVKVDCDLLLRMSRDMEVRIEQLSARIFEIAGQEFNLNSPRQMADVLYEKLHLPVKKRTRKGGHLSTGVEVLEELAESYEIAGLILDYRELSKLKGTYLDALPKLVNPSTGRIHTSYNQMVAATGRLSSSNPNLQNIPIKSELGREIRRAFVAPPGFKILAADYSQLELRIMAHLSSDPVLLESFRKGEDIHERTAREIFGMNAIMEPQKFRRHAKVINFGIMYGLSAYGLARSLKIDRREAQKIIDNYFSRYQGVSRWIEKTLREVEETGIVRTLYGRIRQIPEIRSKNRNVRGFGERTAINAPIQGTEADLIKKAMVSLQGQIDERELKSRLIMQVHDELVFEVADEEEALMRSLVREKMEGAAQLQVPLQVDLSLGHSWYEAK